MVSHPYGLRLDYFNSWSDLEAFWREAFSLVLFSKPNPRQHLLHLRTQIIPPISIIHLLIHNTQSQVIGEAITKTFPPHATTKRQCSPKGTSERTLPRHKLPYYSPI